MIKGLLFFIFANLLQGRHLYHFSSSLKNVDFRVPSIYSHIVLQHSQNSRKHLGSQGSLCS